jgi:cell division protein FtsB
VTKKQQKPLLGRRTTLLIWAALVSIVILLVSAFSRAWQTNQALQAELATLQPMLTAVMNDQATLEARLAYVQSDEFIEEWSRTHAGMARSGETLVIPITTTPAPEPTATPEPTVIPTPPATPEPFWARWWRSITGATDGE